MFIHNKINTINLPYKVTNKIDKVPIEETLKLYTGSKFVHLGSKKYATKWSYFKLLIVHKKIQV